jgi:hypothetical protein
MDLVDSQNSLSRERIALAHWNRKRKQKALTNIRQAILRWINSHRKRKLNDRDLDNLMIKIIPNTKAIKIQKWHRGNMGRARAKKMWWAIKVIQRFLRNARETRTNVAQFRRTVQEMHSAASRIQGLFGKAAKRKQDRLKRAEDRQHRASRKRSEAVRRAILMSDLKKRTTLINATNRIQAKFRSWYWCCNTIFLVHLC